MLFALADMTWPEVQEALKTVQLGIIPVGAHEQHGPHLKESCDARLADEFARKLTARLSPFALMTPAVPFGLSSHHIHFPGTITLRSTTFISLLRDMVWSLKEHGLKKFLIVNAHGGNQSVLSVACTEISMELDVEVYYAKTTAAAKDSIGRHVKSTLYGHSCEREVSEALYLAPDLVHPDRLEAAKLLPGKWASLRPGNPIQGAYFYESMTANGCLGDATMASLQAGREIVDEALSKLAEAARELFNF